MKKFLHFAPLALAIAAGSVSAQSTEDTLARMQQQLDSMQQQVNTAKNDRVRFNGFFSTGVAKSSNDAGFDGITEKTSVADLSLFALQGTFDVSDKSQAVFQLVGRGAEDWDPVVEWAYLSYRPINNLQLRAGKMRLPLFMYSDSLEVGYSQPWARPPQSVYGPISIKSYVGADATYTMNLDNSAVTGQLFTGFTDEEGTTGPSELRNVFGTTLSWTDYVWTARAIVGTAQVNIDIDLNQDGVHEYALSDGERALFLGLGLGYDDGIWQVISEVTRAKIDGEFADTDSAYVSVGRRFGSVTPYAVIGWIESTDNDDRTFLGPALNTRRDEYSIGARWDITPGVAIKGDVTHVTGFENAAGGLDAAYVLPAGKNSTNVYTLKLDSAF
ncbi:hypothetical protein FE848_08245 [Marinobacter sp. 1-3A]|uniref:hypothetical protein n=1 Tax=Marinobacter sp. 1-3A TaxID=2582920 RepID=UPI001906FB95|nr:hypothetical protein [Marinobacter sp. 1-3A]MBK1873210.1 hypothetical protein [Marinobacter sp. 1-3A]